MKPNLFDFIAFPDNDGREEYKSKYSQLKLCQISRDLNAKKPELFEDPDTHIAYQTHMQSVINEYNSRIFYLLVPLYQMVYYYETYKNTEDPMDKLYYERLFWHQNDIPLYGVYSVFDKSFLIFNYLYEFYHKEDHQIKKNVLASLKSMSMEAATDTLNLISKIRKEPIYTKLQEFRNDNTHNFSGANSTMRARKVNNTVYYSALKHSDPNEIFSDTLECLQLVNTYSISLDSIIEKFYLETSQTN